jgi:hypothetical protein
LFSESFLQYPVLCSGVGLAISEAKRKQLLSELQNLAELRNDHHEREPVCDIIDPALHALLLPVPHIDDENVAFIELTRAISTIKQHV